MCWFASVFLWVCLFIGLGVVGYVAVLVFGLCDFRLPSLLCLCFIDLGLCVCCL